MKKFCLVAFAFALLAIQPSAWAYKACTDSYAGGCHLGTHCDFYDDETDQWIGSITIEYQC